MNDQAINLNIRHATIHLVPQPSSSISLGLGMFSSIASGFAGEGDLKADATTTAPAPATAKEMRDLGDGKEISQDQALKEIAALNEPADPAFVWRLETPHELFASIDYDHKNANGAYSRDESIKKGWYWSHQASPAFEGARVVVGFSLGDVDYGYGGYRCFARAVRVARQ